jgi:hypothetical protein
MYVVSFMTRAPVKAAQALRCSTSGKVIGITLQFFDPEHRDRTLPAVRFAFSLLEKSGWTPPGEPEKKDANSLSRVRTGKQARWHEYCRGCRRT